MAATPEQIQRQITELQAKLDAARAEAAAASKRPHAMNRLTVDIISEWLATSPKTGAKLGDGGSMFLTMQRSGNPSWQLRHGASKVISFGTYPTVDLEAARAARDTAREQLALGLDPRQEKRAVIAANIAAQGQTFEVVAREWLADQALSWTPKHLSVSTKRLESYVFPKIGQFPVAKVPTAKVSELIKELQRRNVGKRHAPGRRETAGKVLQHVAKVFEFAKGSGLIDTNSPNPAAPVRTVLVKRPAVNRRPALVTFPALGDVLRRVEASNSSDAVKLCHRLIAFTGVRVGNAVSARWQDMDLDACTWTIPRDRMKSKDQDRPDFKVVLPAQLVEHLKKWRETQPKKAVYLFEGKGREHIIEDTIEKLLREKLGLRGKHVPHGWRSSLKTLALEDEEQGFDPTAIEIATDHVVGTATQRAYDRGTRFNKRVELAKWWGDNLSKAESGAA